MLFSLSAMMKMVMVKMELVIAVVKNSGHGDYGSYCITVMIMMIAMVVMKIKLLITVVI